MKVKLVNEAVSDVLKPKDVGPEMVENALTLQQREEIDSILINEFDL